MNTHKKITQEASVYNIGTNRMIPAILFLKITYLYDQQKINWLNIQKKPGSSIMP